MFSGIVECRSWMKECRSVGDILRVTCRRPSFFEDIQRGDSIAVNGVCLTIEHFNQEFIQFSLAPETLKVTGWDCKNLLEKEVNLERSLRLGDRIHGHLVFGHVDGMAEVCEVQILGGSRILKFSFPKGLSSYLWTKGSAAINGVSLTLNHVDDQEIEVCLIPETLERTNLGTLEVGDRVTLEVDSFARGLIRYFEDCQKKQVGAVKS